MFLIEGHFVFFAFSSSFGFDWRSHFFPSTWYQKPIHKTLDFIEKCPQRICPNVEQLKMSTRRDFRTFYWLRCVSLQHLDTTLKYVVLKYISGLCLITLVASGLNSTLPLPSCHVQRCIYIPKHTPSILNNHLVIPILLLWIVEAQRPRRHGAELHQISIQSRQTITLWLAEEGDRQDVGDANNVISTFLSWQHDVFW